MTDPLLGRIAAERVRMLATPMPDLELLRAYRELDDASALVSDVLDELCIAGAIAASELVPRQDGRHLVGAALTVRNEIEPGPLAEKSARGAPMGMQDVVAHNLAQPGNVLVIQGVAGISNLGGLSALLGRRQGECGAIVDGGVRDVADFRRDGFPVWSSGLTPISGRWRIETAEINGAVQICGVQVAPGDLVIADDTGVVFVPLHLAGEVLARCRRKHAADAVRAEAIARGDGIELLFGAAARKAG